MSSFCCEVVTLGKVGKHPKADSLSITTIDGGPCIFRTGDFMAGGNAIYVPIEAVVPLDNPAFAFLKQPDRPNKTTYRIRARRIRGIFSMGMLIPTIDDSRPGTDMAARLGIVKYEEPEESLVDTGNERDPGFMPVYEIDSWRKHQGAMVLGEQVYVSEKLHGQGGRWTFRDGRLWVGSHRCIKARDERNRWWQIAAKYGLEEKLKNRPRYVVYGEVYGSKVQDLQYDCPPGEVRMAVFDVYDSNAGTFLGYENFVRFCAELDLPRVTQLYVGPYDPELLVPMAEGPSTIANHIREGWVVKPVVERWHITTGRVILKLVSEQYLIRSKGTEFH